MAEQSATAAGRVALGLIYAAMSGDREGTKALMAGLRESCDPCSLDVCAALAALGAAALDEAGVSAEDFAGLQREAGLR